MNIPNYFCAGSEMKDLPGGTVENLFLSAVTAGKTETQIRNSMELSECSKSVNKIVDSGGSTLGIAEKDALKKRIVLPLNHFITDLNLSPKYVVKTATRLGATEFVALDFPIQEVPVSEREAEFKRKLAYNLPWAIETAELREKYCPQIGLLIPVQCFTLQQLDGFLDGIKDLSFSGLAMPTRAATLTEVALFLHRFWQAGIRRVHLLGVSHFLMLALSGYMARHYFDEFSVDSTTWRKQGSKDIYMNPHNLTKIVLDEHTQIDPKIKMDCGCPWCRNKTFSYVKHLPRPDRCQFLFCHNFFVISRMCETLYQHAGSIDELAMFIETRASSGQRQRVKGVDEVQDLIAALSVIETLKDKDTRHLEKLLIH